MSYSVKSDEKRPSLPEKGVNARSTLPVY